MAAGTLYILAGIAVVGWLIYAPDGGVARRLAQAATGGQS